MTYLPDVNIWIALSAGEHVHHRAAATWFDAIENDMVAFCRVTQMGFLRLLTNARVMFADVFTARQAWRWLDQLMHDDRVVFAAEPSGLEQVWRRMTGRHEAGANFWTDTYLAAFGKTSGYTIVTFDRHFEKQEDLAVRLLSSERR